MPRPLKSLAAILCLALVVLAAGTVVAQPSLTWIGPGTASDLSADGHVITGFTPLTLDVFRWTAAGGMENLGGSTVHVGIGAGEPKINADGSRISATVATADSAHITMGMWTRNEGWQELPLPDHGISVDGNLGSSWNISSDGTTVVGLVWVPPARAHASSWSAVAGPLDLGSQGGDSRANAVNGDGSVVAGWSADPTTGTWQPTVWENGAMTVLDPTSPIAECLSVTADGLIIGGQSENPDTGQAEATLYFKDAGEPNGWNAVRLGLLPDTNEFEGRSMVTDASLDGGIVVGLNYYTNFSRVDFIWTPTLGMMKAREFLTQAGIILAPTFLIQRISGVSDDGRYLLGYGYDLYTPGETQSFLVDLGGVSPVPTVSRPMGMQIEPNVPNPFNPSTTLALSVTESSRVNLVIHDARGRVVRRLHEGPLHSGRHTWTWNGRDDGGRSLASGVYLAVATDGNGARQSQRMTLVK